MSRARRGRRPPRRPVRRGRGGPPRRPQPGGSGPPPSGRVPRARPPSGRFPPRGGGRSTNSRKRVSDSGEFRARSPKSFEVRRGRSSSDSADEDDSSGEIPLSHVVLPQSITQEAEEDSLRRRFDTEHLPTLSPLDDRVQLRESAGARGPDRYRRRRLIVFMVFLLIAAGLGAAYVYQNPELRRQYFGGE